MVWAGVSFGAPAFLLLFVPVLLKIYKMGLAPSDFSLEVVAEFSFGFIFAV